MGRNRTRSRGKLPLELRLTWWLLRLAWRLPVWLLAVVGSVLWLITWPLRRQRPSEVEPLPADAFYRSHGWRSLRVDALEGNRERYGALTCECCRTVDTGQWHVDHIRPRSSHPELALEVTNLQVLCEDCNVGKDARYITDWRYEEPA